MMTLSVASLRIDPRCHPVAPSLLALAWLLFGFLSLGGRISYPYDIPPSSSVPSHSLRCSRGASR
jgi:hypothetical protein